MITLNSILKQCAGLTNYGRTDLLEIVSNVLNDTMQKNGRKLRAYRFENSISISFSDFDSKFFTPIGIIKMKAKKIMSYKYNMYDRFKKELYEVKHEWNCKMFEVSDFIDGDNFCLYKDWMNTDIRDLENYAYKKLDESNAHKKDILDEYKDIIERITDARLELEKRMNDLSSEDVMTINRTIEKIISEKMGGDSIER